MKKTRYEAWTLSETLSHGLEAVPTLSSHDPVWIFPYLQLISTEYHRAEGWVNILLHGMGCTLRLEGRGLDGLPDSIAARNVRSVCAFDPEIHKAPDKSAPIIEKMVLRPMARLTPPSPKRPPPPSMRRDN